MKLFRFLPNRVWRVYEGGSSIDSLRGESVPDGCFPEEWIASTVPARNPRRGDPAEGISHVAMPDGGTIRFDHLLAEEGKTILGREHIAMYGSSPAFLTKLLDSAVRLPVQAHPDRETAKRLFHSGFGKTESWLVLGGRPIGGEEPYLLIGFNERFHFNIFKEEALSGVMNRTIRMMHRWPVVPGEVIMIPGGLPHAIGSGVFVQEIMEPSDWVIQPENQCGSTRLSDEERFNGIPPERALEVFDCTPVSREELRRRIFLSSVELCRSPEAVLHSLIDRHAAGYFGALELHLKGTFRMPERFSSFMAGTVIDGRATVRCGLETLELTRGNAFAVAVGAVPEFQGHARIMFALPPVTNPTTINRESHAEFTTFA